MARNLGHKYEDDVRKILARRSLLPPFVPNDIDAAFVHKGATHYVEIKNKNAPDFGQLKIKYDENSGWQWVGADIVTALLDAEGARNNINAGFKPNKYSLADSVLTRENKIEDQQNIKMSSIALRNVNILYEYYGRKNCFYIQIEGRGFYHMKTDAAGLRVPRFAPRLTLRLRAKTHHSEPVHAYSFFAVIQADVNSVSPSPYDLENDRKFPAISKT